MESETINRIEIQPNLVDHGKILDVLSSIGELDAVQRLRECLRKNVSAPLR